MLWYCGEKYIIYNIQLIYLNIVHESIHILHHPSLSEDVRSLHPPYHGGFCQSPSMICMVLLSMRNKLYEPQHSEHEYKPVYKHDTYMLSSPCLFIFFTLSSL